MAEQEKAQPFISSVFRRDTLEELSTAPLAALEARLEDLLGGRSHPDEKKDGKDGASESSITFGDVRLTQTLRIKDDKLQSEKHKDASDGSSWSEYKEACDLRQVTTVYGSSESLDWQKIRVTEELRATRRGVELRRGGPIF